VISEIMPGEYSRRPLQILGACWLAYGIVEVCAGICLILVRHTATLMFGALLSRVPDPFALMDLFHLLYLAAIALSAVSGVLGIVSGWALLAGLPSARIVALVAASVSLLRVPLGTALGVVSLVMLLPLTRYAVAVPGDDRALDPRLPWRDAAKAR
jgi:hypothetical protein